jgi:hypothetical protein
MCTGNLSQVVREPFYELTAILDENSERRKLTECDSIVRLSQYLCGKYSWDIFRAVEKENKPAILFYDGLIKEFEKQNFQVAGEGSQKVAFTSVFMGDDKVYLRLEEPGSFNRTKAKSKSSWRAYDYDYYTTGKLRLQISKYDSNHWAKTISDTEDLKLEYQIEKIFKTILHTADEAKKCRIEREEKAKREEQQRIIHERLRREEELEQKKKADLEQASSSFTKSHYIYQYIHEVEIQIIQQELNQEQLARFIKWKNWATKHADRLNPIKQKIESILNPVEEEESKLHLW